MVLGGSGRVKLDERRDGGWTARRRARLARRRSAPSRPARTGSSASPSDRAARATASCSPNGGPRSPRERLARGDSLAAPVPSAPRSRARRQPVALVLAGGGARGAYEAGVLEVLAPRAGPPRPGAGHPRRHQHRALNSAFLAARAHEPLAQVAQAAGGDVERARLERRAAPAGVRSRAAPPAERGCDGRRVLPGWHLPGLLDPSPLRHTLTRLVSFERLARNVMDGSLTAAAVVATSYANTRSVVFHHGGTPPRGRPRPRARIRRHADPARARARLGRDPGSVSGRRGAPPPRAGWLVQRRRRAPERAARARARAGGAKGGGDRPELVGHPSGPRAAPRRARRARPAGPGRALRPAGRRRGHARHRQREPPGASHRGKGVPAGGYPTSSSPPKTAWRSAASPAACTRATTAESTACCAGAAWPSWAAP